MDTKTTWKAKTKYVQNKASALYDEILQERGHQCEKICGLRGNTYGAAGPCRRLTPEEKAKVEADLRANGII